MAEQAPMSGITIIDFTQAMLGPAATMMLADFGAKVIKIERKDVGDLSRWPATRKASRGANPVFDSLNRNKLSLSLDLRQDSGRQVARALLAKADVVVSNFRPGVMQRLGFDYETLCQDNPGIIWATGTGFGLRGPNAHKGGQDVLAQAMSGLMARKSDPAHPLAVYATCLADYTAAMHLAQGIAFALLARERTGRGQVVDVSLFDSMLAMQTQEAATWLETEEELNWGAMPLTAAFETADEPIVVVGAFRENPLRDICAALEIDDLSKDPKFSTMEAMKANQAELRGLLQEAFLRSDRETLLERLDKEDVLCAPVRSMQAALDDEQTQVNDMVWHLNDGEREISVVGCPVHLSETPARFYAPPPNLGSNGDEVLAELGFSASEIAALREEGVVG